MAGTSVVSEAALPSQENPKNIYELCQMVKESTGLRVLIPVGEECARRSVIPLYGDVVQNVGDLVIVAGLCCWDFVRDGNNLVVNKEVDCVKNSEVVLFRRCGGLDEMGLVRELGLPTQFSIARERFPYAVVREGVVAIKCDFGDVEYFEALIGTFEAEMYSKYYIGTASLSPDMTNEVITDLSNRLKSLLGASIDSLSGVHLFQSSRARRFILIAPTSETLKRMNSLIASYRLSIPKALEN